MDTISPKPVLLAEEARRSPETPAKTSRDEIVGVVRYALTSSAIVAASASCRGCAGLGSGAGGSTTIVAVPCGAERPEGLAEWVPQRVLPPRWCRKTSEEGRAKTTSSSSIGDDDARPREAEHVCAAYSWQPEIR